jgi:DnaK suppressor protein
MNIDPATYKKLLLEIEAKLVADLKNLGHKDQNSEVIWDTEQKEDADPADREDVAEAIEEYEHNEETTRVLETELHEARHALQKIENGTFGVCESCGGPIEDDRLHANPAARNCKKCM